MFDEPLLVSNNFDFEHHGVSVTILKEEMFYSIYGDPIKKASPESQLVLNQRLPLQNPNDSEIVAVQEAIKDFAQSAGQTAVYGFSTSAGMRVFMGLSLNSIMNKLILLQLILLPSAFKILLPMNVIEVSRVLLSLAFFDILPSEDITRAMFDVHETDATYESLEKLGLESDNFLLNVGSSLIFLHSQFAIIFLG